MNVIVNIGRKIVVDDVGDIRNIETTGGNSSCNHDGESSGTEHLQGTLTLALSAVSMNGRRLEILVDKEIAQGIRHAFSLDEDEGKVALVGVENIEKNRALVGVLDVLDLLCDVLGSGTDTTNRKENVIPQEIAGQHLDIPGEGGGKHERLSVLGLGHVLALNDTANLRLETHVQHAVSLIEDEVLDVAERDAATLDEIDKTTRGSDEEIATTLNEAELRSDIGTTVDDTGLDPRSVGELASLLVDLRNQLTGGGQDESSGVRLASVSTESSVASTRGGGRSDEEGLRKDGEQETTSLSGT